MSRPALPTFGSVIVDTQNSPTIEFNAWLQGIDEATAPHGVGAREPLPPVAIVIARRPTIPFLKWLLWADRSIRPLATNPQSLPKETPILGVDRKPTIPFYAWCHYVDLTLP
jgi:hypothetical protein